MMYVAVLCLFRSLLGGQRIMLYGAGFSDTASVLLGDIKCEVETATSNSIQCVTQSSTKTHYVDNFGYTVAVLL